MKVGGTKGGEGLFFGGLALIGLGVYFFLDSIYVTTGHGGIIGRMFGRGGQGHETTSMGIVFVPLLIGIGTLFYDARKKWAWWLAGLGLLLIIIESLSRIRFEMNQKTTLLLLMLGMIAAGAGMVFRGLWIDREAKKSEEAKAKAEKKA